jgi:amidohydrolase
MLHTRSETKLSTPQRTGLRSIALAGLLACGLPLGASAQGLDAQGLAALDAAIQPLAPKMVEWRRDIHQHPELSGQEERTA